jgi:hypothetical protein
MLPWVKVTLLQLLHLRETMVVEALQIRFLGLMLEAVEVLVLLAQMVSML